MPIARLSGGVRPAALIGLLVCIGPWAPRPVAQQRPSVGEITIVDVRPNFYMLAGGGANIGVAHGPDGFILVDSGSAAMADKVLAALDKLADRLKTKVQGGDVLPKVRLIVNTSAHPDHVGGNEKLSKAGLTFFSGAAGGGGGAGFAGVIANSGAAAILAHETVTQRMSAPTPGGTAFPVGAWPTESYTGRLRSYYLNDMGVQVLFQPRAYSDGDSVVTFRQPDVIVTGEVFDITRFPTIDLARGGSIQGTLDALSRLVDMAIPAQPHVWKEGRTVLIPARGRVCDQADLVEYRDAMTIVRDNIQDLIQRGLSLEDIKKANPTRAYRSRYGTDAGPWTTDMFIEAVYKSLTAKRT
jgi:cyclase